MTKEKSQAAASKAQLWHEKGPAARPLDWSLRCRQTVNIKAVEATVLVATAAFYRCHRRVMWQA